MPAAPPTPPRTAVDPLVALADRCVQCGLCLPTCPTYAATRLETESPRGRIALARAWATRAAEPTPAGDAHLDHCLGCRNCEAACPAGVEFGALLVQARERQRGRRVVPWHMRLLEALAARPTLLARCLAAYRIAHPLLPARLRPLPRPPAPSRPARVAAPPVAGIRRVAVFRGCVAGTYEAPLRQALARLCTALGVELVEPAGQACCGTLHAHAGNGAMARRLAAGNRAAFEGHATVLTLASGCHEAVDAALEARTVDALAFLASHAHRLRFRPLNARVALHLPCTQRNVTRGMGAMRDLLALVPGLELVELDPAMGCCGAAGVAMLQDPVRAAAFRAPLLAQLEASGTTRVLSANIGCRLHLGNGTSLPVQHPLELLAGQLDPCPSPGVAAAGR